MFKILFIADKLCTDAGNTVTLFLDPNIDNAFMKNLSHDLKNVYNSKIQVITHQVNRKQTLYKGSPPS